MPPTEIPAEEVPGFHPLRTWRSGAVVSMDHPNNRRHRRGVWAALNRTKIDGRKPDLLNMGQKQGRLDMIQWLGARESTHGTEIETRHCDVGLAAQPPLSATVLFEG